MSLRNDVWFSRDRTPIAKSDRTHIPELAAQKFGEEAEADMNNFFDVAISKQCLTTEPLSQGELSKLLASLVECQRIAYDWDGQLDIPNLIEYMDAQPVRTHIRAALEALDINYTYKQTIIPKVIDLVEGSVKEEDGFLKDSEA